MADARYEQLTQLGKESPLPASPAEAVLETVANPHPGTVYLVRFTCPEFTTLGPVTGRLIAEMITGEKTLIDPKPYRAERF